MDEKPMFFREGKYTVEAERIIARTGHGGMRFFVLEMRVLSSTSSEIPIGTKVSSAHSMGFPATEANLHEIATAFDNKEITRCMCAAVWHDFNIEVSGKADVSCFPKALRTTQILVARFSPSSAPPQPIRCECGSEKTGSPRHSSWCAKAPK